MSCPVTYAAPGDNCFFCGGDIHWDAHRIGWAVAGTAAVVTALITLFTLTMHATHYQQPAAQKQVMRVVLMPPVYAIVSFFSYRYYREYEYYVLAETAYEAITLSAFLMLLMELVSMSTNEGGIRAVLAEKDKRKLPFPFNFIRFRASKPYFIHALSFSVMQYVVIRPAISIAGIITEYYGVLCHQKYSVHYAEAYLDAVDFVSISVALYGLIVFYVLCKEQLRGRRPLNKFLAIKLIVFFTFYQGFIFDVLQNYNVIKPTAFWTADNIADGLNALCTTLEMVVFSAYMCWAYSWTEYTDPARNPHLRRTGARTYFSAIWDTINLSDFAIEIWLALKFFVRFILRRPGTRGQATKLQRTFMPEENSGDDATTLHGDQPGKVTSKANGEGSVYANGGDAESQRVPTSNGWKGQREMYGSAAPTTQPVLPPPPPHMRETNPNANFASVPHSKGPTPPIPPRETKPHATPSPFGDSRAIRATEDQHDQAQWPVAHPHPHQPQAPVLPPRPAQASRFDDRR